MGCKSSRIESHPPGCLVPEGFTACIRAPSGDHQMYFRCVCELWSATERFSGGFFTRIRITCPRVFECELDPGDHLPFAYHHYNQHTWFVDYVRQKKGKHMRRRSTYS